MLKISVPIERIRKAAGDTNIDDAQLADKFRHAVASVIYTQLRRQSIVTVDTRPAGENVADGRFLGNGRFITVSDPRDLTAPISRARAIVNGVLESREWMGLQ